MKLSNAARFRIVGHGLLGAATIGTVLLGLSQTTGADFPIGLAIAAALLTGTGMYLTALARDKRDEQIRQAAQQTMDHRNSGQDPNLKTVRYWFADPPNHDKLVTIGLMIQILSMLVLAAGVVLATWH